MRTVHTLVPASFRLHCAWTSPTLSHRSYTQNAPRSHGPPGGGSIAGHSKPPASPRPELAAQGSPSEDGRALFTVHAGTEVRVERRLGGWVEITLGHDLKGWVPEDTIAVI